MFGTHNVFDCHLRAKFVLLVDSTNSAGPSRPSVRESQSTCSSPAAWDVDVRVCPSQFARLGILSFVARPLAKRQLQSSLINVIKKWTTTTIADRPPPPPGCAAPSPTGNFRLESSKLCSRQDVVLLFEHNELQSSVSCSL